MIELIQQSGGILIATSDSRGAISDPNGLDVQKILELKKTKSSVVDYTSLSSEGRTLSNQELLELECDILIPAALENQITSENAQKIQAKLILELANGPITPDADTVLYKK